MQLPQFFPLFLALLVGSVATALGASFEQTHSLAPEYESAFEAGKARLKAASSDAYCSIDQPIEELDPLVSVDPSRQQELMEQWVCYYIKRKETAAESFHDEREHLYEILSRLKIERPARAGLFDHRRTASETLSPEVRREIFWIGKQMIVPAYYRIRFGVAQDLSPDPEMLALIEHMEAILSAAVQSRGEKSIADTLIRNHFKSSGADSQRFIKALCRETWHAKTNEVFEARQMIAGSLIKGGEVSVGDAFVGLNSIIDSPDQRTRSIVSPMFAVIASLNREGVGRWTVFTNCMEIREANRLPPLEQVLAALIDQDAIWALREFYSIYRDGQGKIDLNIYKAIETLFQDLKPKESRITKLPSRGDIKTLASKERPWYFRAGVAKVLTQHDVKERGEVLKLLEADADPRVRRYLQAGIK